MPQEIQKSRETRKVKSHTNTPRDIRIRLGHDDQVLLDELALAYGTTSAEAIRRAIVADVERIRQGRQADRLDTIRASVVTIQEQIASLGRRMEASIEVEKSIERSILGSLEEVKTIGVNTGLNVMAMIETSAKAELVQEKVKEIINRR